LIFRYNSGISLVADRRFFYDFFRNPAISVLPLKHRPRPEEQEHLRRPRLIEPRPELVKLAVLIDWEVFERDWVGFFAILQRSAFDAAAIGGGVALSPARLSAVGRGSCRPLCPNPQLPTLHRGSFPSASPADRSVIADALAGADR
jgi:hypothetical protein